MLQMSSTKPLPNERYTLAANTFACVHGKHVVILDLTRDRYLQLDRRYTGQLVHRIHRWPSQDVTLNVNQESHSAAIDQSVADLLSFGVITDNQTPPSEVQPRPICTPEVDLVEIQAIKPKHYSAAIIRCYWASVIARRKLRGLPLISVLNQVTDIRRRKVGTSLDLQEISGVVNGFLSLRPFLRSAKDACLFESLSLLICLSMYNVSANWVFGVKTEPFFAHCWLQKDNVVINDMVDNVRQFTPIMII
jgi:Transglutaminase-like superfamily